MLSELALVSAVAALYCFIFFVLLQSHSKEYDLKKTSKK